MKSEWNYSAPPNQGNFFLLAIRGEQFPIVGRWDYWTDSWKTYGSMECIDERKIYAWKELEPNPPNKRKKISNV